MRSAIASLLLAAVLWLTACHPISSEVTVRPGPANTELVSTLEKRLQQVQNESDTRQEVLQSVSGDVYGVQNAAEHLPDSNPTEAVKAQAGLAASKLPPPTEEQRAAKERDNLLFLQGKLDEARAAVAREQTRADELTKREETSRVDRERLTADLEALKAKANAEQARQKSDLEKILAEKDAAVKRARDEAYAQRNKIVFYALVGIASLAAVVGVLLAIATQGRELIRAGVAWLVSAMFFGTAKMISHPYFVPIFATALGLVLVGVAVFVWHDWKTKKLLETKEISADALQKAVGVIDEFKTKAPDAAKTLLQDLNGAFDDLHKQQIRKLRGKTA